MLHNYHDYYCVVLFTGLILLGVFYPMLLSSLNYRYTLRRYGTSLDINPKNRLIHHHLSAQSSCFVGSFIRHLFMPVVLQQYHHHRDAVRDLSSSLM
jgi:hypothetical protein